MDAHDELERLGLVRGGYGHGPQPPRDLDPVLLDALTYPPAPDGAPPGRVRDITIPITEERWAVADGATVAAWTYGGRVPGPVIRATEGDRLRIRVENRTARAHNLHLHGSHDPQMDGWEPIPGGESFTYEIEAGPAGLHPYHCHLPPFAEHLRRGLYGAMIVDPPGGREPATEVHRRGREVRMDEAGGRRAWVDVVEDACAAVGSRRHGAGGAASNRERGRHGHRWKDPSPRRGRNHRLREGGVVDRGGDARGQPAVDGQPLRVADLLPVQRRVSRDQRVAGARGARADDEVGPRRGCAGFPLLYHWRLLPGDPPPPEPEHADLDEAVAYWHGAEGVARRLAAIRASTTALLLFLEHQPHRLDTWLRDRLDAGGTAAAEAIEMVDDTLLAPVVWMNQQGLFHFDSHLANLLTDGRQVLVTDFGLATARDFALDDDERRFLDQHRLHDPAYTVTKFVNFLVTELTGITDPRARDAYIAEHASGRAPGGLPPAAEAIVRRYAPVAEIINSVYWQLFTERRDIEFPTAELAAGQRPVRTAALTLMTRGGTGSCGGSRPCSRRSTSHSACTW
jgi:hypothetical protein